jgi:hypothetical protein
MRDSVRIASSNLSHRNGDHDSSSVMAEGDQAGDAYNCWQGL